MLANYFKHPLTVVIATLAFIIALLFTTTFVYADGLIRSGQVTGIGLGNSYSEAEDNSLSDGVKKAKAVCSDQGLTYVFIRWNNTFNPSSCGGTSSNSDYAVECRSTGEAMCVDRH